MVFKTLFPIFIPSKGRPKSNILKCLNEATESLHYVFVIEPQDRAEYEQSIPTENLCIMQENNRGIAYARNFILDMARESGVYWFWMLDDDVSRFVVGRDKKNHQLPINVALMECQKILGGIARTMPTLVQAALEYQQFTWSAAGNKQYRLNGYCDVCVAMNAKVIPPTARYRGFVNLKEDRDFTLQLLSDGYRTCRFSQIGFAAPKNGTNKGGLYDVYKNGTEATASRRMVEVWGDDICKTEIKPDGRPDVKINWKMFKNN